MKKPTILYRFDPLSSGEKKIVKHTVSKDCCPVIEIDITSDPKYPYIYGGNLWRCKCSTGDHFGYATRQEAIQEERINTHNRILEDQSWLKKLNNL